MKELDNQTGGPEKSSDANEFFAASVENRTLTSGSVGSRLAIHDGVCCIIVNHRIQSGQQNG